MFTIDVYSNEDYYIILRNGRKFCLIDKAVNSVTDILKFFHID